MEESSYITRGFHWADYLIFGVIIAVSSAIGVYFACSGGKQKTTAEYLLGNRQQKIGPVAMSLVVSFESSIMMLGYPAEMYAYGTLYWTSLIGYFFCCMIVSQTFVPLLHPLKLTSSYEYLNYRFNSRGVRHVASVLGITSYSWYMGIVLFGPATALEAVTGFPIAYSIVLVTVAAVFYTAIGGIKAVIWSDALQFFIMLMGLLAVVIMGTVAVGGIGKVMEYCEQGGRIKLYDFNPDPRTRHTFWNLIVGGSIRSLGMGINQSCVQRISSVKTLSGAKIVMMLTFPGFLLFYSLAYMEGLIAYAYFAHTECDPLGAKFINNANQIVPYFIMELFSKQPGLPGLFLASLFSASLSTLSSGFSAMSAMLWSDFLKQCFPRVSEVTATLIAKCTVIVLGGIAIGIAFLVMQVGGTLNQITGTLLDSMGGPLAGLFVLGALFPSATAKGAITGASVTFVVMMWIAMGSSFSPLTVKTPFLPPASTNKCYENVNASVQHQFTMPVNWNVTEFTSVAEINFTTAPLTEKELTGAESFLSYMYSLSYMWYMPISTVLTIVIGLVVSHATGANPPGTVDPKYIIPLFDNLFCYLPSSVREKLRYGKDFVPKGEDEEQEDIFQKTEDGEFVMVIHSKQVNYDVTKGHKDKIDNEALLVSDKTTNVKME